MKSTIRRILAISVIAALSASATQIALPTSAAANTTSVSSVHAGGFVNVIATDPTGTYAVAGTDSAGVFRSVKPGGGQVGDSWQPVSGGFAVSAKATDISARTSISSVAWDPGNAGVLYSLSGRSQSSNQILGHVYKSADYGTSWAPVDLGTLSFAAEGGNWADPDKNGTCCGSHPRLTGHLVDFNKGYATSTVYVGALDKIFRFGAANTTAPKVLADLGVEFGGNGQTVSLYSSSGGTGSDTVWALLRDKRDGSDNETSAQQATDNGVVRITAAQGSGFVVGALRRPSCLSGTERADEMVLVDEGGKQVQYVSWGKAGLWRFDISASSPWTFVASYGSTPGTCGSALRSINSGSNFFSWPAIDAITDAASSKTAIVLGGMAQGTKSCPAGNSCPSIQVVTVDWSSGISAATPSNAISSGSTSTVMPNGQEWWHSKDFSSSDPSAVADQLSATPPTDPASEGVIGHSDWVASMVEILPGSTASSMTMIVTGRGGIWRGTWPSSLGAWKPVNVGVSNTFSLGVALWGATHAVSIDTDWQVLTSTDLFASALPHNHQILAQSPRPDPVDVAFDEDGSAYVGYDDGTVYYNYDPYGSTSSTNCWISLGNAGQSVGTGSYPISSIVAGSDLSVGKKRVTVALSGAGDVSSGVFRKVITPGCTGQTSTGWAQMGSTIALGGNDVSPARVRLYYDATSSTKRFFAFDEEQGLLRSSQTTSTAFGNFQLIVPRGSTDTPSERSVRLAVNPNNHSILYFDYDKSAYKLTSAGSCAAPCNTSTFLTSLTTTLTVAQLKFGAIAVGGDGAVAITNGVPDTNASGTSGTIQFLKASSSGGTSLSNVADSTYANLAFKPNHLAATTTASPAYVAALSAAGVIRITP